MTVLPMTDKLFVAKIVSSTSADGPGLRNSLYVSGCPIHCEGCHNSDWWDLKSGTMMSIDEVYLQLNKDPFNISILGGEPLLQYEAILELCKRIKSKTAKTIWLWSGYTFEIIQNLCPDILDYIDTLVDGAFVKEQATPNLKWRGSKNQRIITLH